MKRHNECIFFANHDCAEKDNEVMKRARHGIPKTSGGYIPTNVLQKSAEIEAICVKCDKFMARK